MICVKYLRKLLACGVTTFYNEVKFSYNTSGNEHIKRVRGAEAEHTNVLGSTPPRWHNFLNVSQLVEFLYGTHVKSKIEENFNRLY